MNNKEDKSVKKEKRLLQAYGQSIVVNNTGGICGDWEIPLSCGSFKPLHKASWLREAPKTSSLSDNLEGIFLCLPFGNVESELYVHGIPANSLWVFEDGADDYQKMRYDFSLNSPFSYVTQVVRLEKNAVKLDYIIMPKKNCRQPVGFHAIFSTKHTPIKVKPGAFSHGRTFPHHMLDKDSLLLLDAAFSSLDALPKRNGGSIDGTQLPWKEKCEEIVQLINIDGQCQITYPDKECCISIEWDPKKLPHLLLWYSNQGRDFAPWNGENLSLGIEPIASYFDFGQEASCADNIISHQNQKQTFINFVENQAYNLSLKFTYKQGVK